MEFTNYKKAVSNRSYLGYAAISFRDADPNRNSHRAFVLNSKDDGWFRRDDNNSIADGFGLAINEIKVTTRTAPVKMGNFNVYKVIIDYTDWSWEAKEERDFFWLYVHENFELKEILDYINENKENWRP